MSDDAEIPHPRRRINEVIEDNEKVYLLLKDKGKVFRNMHEEEWYEQAYGKKRNLMKLSMNL